MSLPLVALARCRHERSSHVGRSTAQSHAGLKEVPDVLTALKDARRKALAGLEAEYSRLIELQRPTDDEDWEQVRLIRNPDGTAHVVCMDLFHCALPPRSDGVLDTAGGGRAGTGQAEGCSCRERRKRHA